MQNSKQRIIFEVPENTTPAKVILDIMKRNEIVDVPYENLKNDEKPKLAIISDQTKDFFMNNLSEKRLSWLLQTQLKITKEKSADLVRDIKKNLIPFAKKIEMKPEIKINDLVINSEENPLSFIKKAPKISVEQNEKKISKIRKTVKPEISIVEKLNKIPKKFAQSEGQKSIGPDSYREPVE